MVGNGGVKDMIVWLPIDQVAAVLKEVIALRKELMEMTSTRSPAYRTSCAARPTPARPRPRSS